MTRETKVVKPRAMWGALLGACLVSLSACSGSSEEQVAALEIEDLAAYWAVKGQDVEQNNYIHPVIRFRVVNQGSLPVGYVQAMAVFKRELFPEEAWGNAFSYSISEEPIEPGESTDFITMRSDSNFISKDAPDQMFLNEKWEQINVEVFLRVGPSNWRLAQGLPIPKQIGAPGLDKFLNPEDPEQIPLPQ